MALEFSSMSPPFAVESWSADCTNWWNWNSSFKYSLWRLWWFTPPPISSFVRKRPRPKWNGLRMEFSSGLHFYFSPRNPSLASLTAATSLLSPNILWWPKKSGISWWWCLILIFLGLQCNVFQCHIGVGMTALYHIPRLFLDVTLSASLCSFMRGDGFIHSYSLEYRNLRFKFQSSLKGHRMTNTDDDFYSKFHHSCYDYYVRVKSSHAYIMVLDSLFCHVFPIIVVVICMIEIWRGPNWGRCMGLSADSYSGHKVITFSFLYLIKNKKQQRYKEGVLLDLKRLLFCFR